MNLGKSTAKNPTICIAYTINMIEDTKLVLTRKNLPTLLAHKLAQTKSLAYSKNIQAPNLLHHSWDE